MNRLDIAHQISTTLGDHAADYDIDAIVDELIETHDGPLNSIDDIDSATYWAIIEKHDTTSKDDTQSRTVTLISANVGDQVPGVELGDPACPNIPGLMDNPQVKQFMADHHYDANHENELMYLVTDESDIPNGFPTLTITLPL